MSHPNRLSPFEALDREDAIRRKEEDRRARYRGFDDTDHFLRLAAERGPTAAVWREYQVIFMGVLPLGVLPFPVIERGQKDG